MPRKPQRPSPRQPAARRDPAATRQRILAAARSLFARQGFDGTGVRQIAHRAGVTRSLVHHHFGSKESLYLAVLERSEAEWAGRLREAVEPAIDSEEFVTEAVRAYHRFLGEHPDFVRMGEGLDLFLAGGADRRRLLADRPRPEDRNERFLHDAPDRVIGRIAELQRRGRLRDDLDPALVLAAVWCLVEHWHEARDRLGLRLGRDLDGPGIDDRFLDTALSILVEGLSPRTENSRTPGGNGGRGGSDG